MLRLQHHRQDRMSTSACHCSPGKKLRAVKHSSGWLLPGVVLVLLPKCPLCLAAWLSLVLGFGMSVTTATVLHATLIILCLLFCIICLVRHFYAFRKSSI